MKNRVIILAIFVFGALNLQSKNDANEFIKKGNQLYNQGKYKEAEIEYRKALELNPQSNIAKYNLGNSLYRQNRFEEAKELFDKVDPNSFSKKALADSYHNLGNSFFQSKNYENSIESYKKALLNNPSDKETKYNLEYARRMLRQQMQSQNQNQQQQQNQQNNKNQQQQHQQSNNQNKDQKNDKGNQQQQNQQDNQNQQQLQHQPKQNISKEDAERILQALMNKEKELQKDMQKKNATRAKLIKNW